MNIGQKKYTKILVKNFIILQKEARMKNILPAESRFTYYLNKNCSITLKILRIVQQNIHT